MTRGIILFIFLTLLTGGPLINAEAKNIKASSAIDEVTVFPGRAMITRTINRNFEPGRYRVEFSNLPVRLHDDSLRVTGKGSAGAKVLNVKVKRKYLEEAHQKEIRELEHQKDNLRKEIQALDDRLAALDKKKQLLNNLTDKTVEAIANKKNVNPPLLQSWKGMIDFVENQSVDILKQKREIEEKKEKLSNRKRVIDGTINKQKSAGQKEVKNAVVDLEIQNSGSLRLGLSYMINGASWEPVYDLRVNSENTNGDFVYSAIVRQSTGENWKNARLTLSTAKPLKVERIPGLSSIFISAPKGGQGNLLGKVTLDDGSPLPGVTVKIKGKNNIDLTTVSNENGVFKFIKLPTGRYNLTFDLEGFNTLNYKDIKVIGGKTGKLEAVMRFAAIQESIAVTGPTMNYDGMNITSLPEMDIQSDDADVEMQEISASFTLKHRDTVIGDGEPQKVTIASKSVKVEKEFLAVPRVTCHTFLKASVKNVLDYAMLAGNISVFYDGGLVNKTNIGFTNPGEKIEFPLGVDEAIKIKRKTLKEFSDKKGLLKKKVIKKPAYEIQIKNLHKTAVKLTIRDQIPVGIGKGVSITLDEIRPEPLKTEKKTFKEDGFLKWKLNIPPGAKRTIKVRYQLVYAEGAILNQWTGSN